MENRRRRVRKEVENGDVFDKMDNLFESENSSSSPTNNEETTVAFSKVETIENLKVEGDINPKTGKPYKEEVIEPMANKKKNSRKKVEKKKKGGKFKKNKIIKILGILFLSGLTLLILMFGYAWANLSEVSEETFFQNTSTTNLYDINGDYITSLGSTQNIDWVDLYNDKGELNVSKHYLEGLLATEDARFFDHGGWDIFGLISATFSTLFTNAQRGGSTITMQVAKLVYMNDWLTNGKDGYSKKVKRYSENPKAHSFDHQHLLNFWTN